MKGYTMGYINIKLSDYTKTVLKSFAKYADTIILPQNGELMFLNNQTSVGGYAKIVENFPFDFRIGNLQNFINVLDSIPEASLLFFDDTTNAIKIVDDKDTKIQITYVAAADTVVQKIYSEQFTSQKMPTMCRFDIEDRYIKQLNKLAGALSKDNIVISSNGKRLKMGCVDETNVNTSVFSVDLGEYTSGTFTYIIEKKNFMLFDGDYTVDIREFVGSVFTNKNVDIKYIIKYNAKLREEFNKKVLYKGLF